MCYVYYIMFHKICLCNNPADGGIAVMMCFIKHVCNNPVDGGIAVMNCPRFYICGAPHVVAGGGGTLHKKI